MSFWPSHTYENTSYSAILNIAESVPPLEPVPSNSGNSVIIQYNISTCHWPSSIKFLEFHAIPELEAILGIPESHGIPCNSGIGSHSRNSVQFRNWMEFPGIPRNSVQLRLHPIPKFRAIPSPPNSKSKSELRDGTGNGYRPVRYRYEFQTGRSPVDQSSSIYFFYFSTLIIL